MVICTDPALIVAASRQPHQGPNMLLTVDGFCGSGKTYLSQVLAERLDGEHVEVDSFVQRHQGGYMPFLTTDELAGRLSALSDDGATVVLEGICMEYVLDVLRIRPHVRIYAQKMNRWGDWTDAPLVDASRTPAEILEEAETEAALGMALLGSEGNTDSSLPLLREVVEYHRSRRPHEMANIVYQWIEDCEQPG